MQATWNYADGCQGHNTFLRYAVFGCFKLIAFLVGLPVFRGYHPLFISLSAATGSR
jgi:hypothetical protein